MSDDEQLEELIRSRNESGRLNLRSEIVGLDEKIYAGRATSRKEMFEQPSTHSFPEDDEDDIEEHSEDGNEMDENIPSDEGSDVSSDEGSGGDGSDIDSGTSNPDLSIPEYEQLGDQLKDIEQQHSTIRVPSASDRELEMQKAAAVRSQQTLTDTFLDFRIRLQRVVDLGNRFPQKGMFEAFQQDEEVKEKLCGCTEAVVEVMNSLAAVQREMFQKNSETAHLTQQSQLFCSLSSDAQMTWKSLQTVQHKMFEWIDPVVDKWNQRTKINTATTASLKVIDQSTISQIRTILSDRERLIKRTQMKRKRYHVIGKIDQEEEAAATATEQFDEEIFDDGDFYQLQLRDLIESGMSGAIEGDAVTSLALARQLAMAQKKLLKKRRKVDTKASKGRKLSFAVQPKLQNFMFAQQVELPSITDELFRNIFK
eukprot:c3440_g1_i1.p1 GENE.c3440_g1_i1~~c3440_g1_i1.p1  ORF type:complete len:474 (+),score=169.07 c3440_g1_i1:149-1423(+)